MPTQAEHAVRASTHTAALNGAFTPKGPVSSKLELDKPVAPAAKLPMSKKPLPSAGPVVNAARPVKPGIFGKLLGLK
jgi:hypothetical protein